MKLLLDTHIFLWFISGDQKLPANVCDVIRDPDNDVYLSAVSIWECIVKYQQGRLPLPESPGIYLPKQRALHQIAGLALDEMSVSQLVKLPLIHKDPFDRMLICQALQNGCTIATVDDKIRAYPVSFI